MRPLRRPLRAALLALALPAAPLAAAPPEAFLDRDAPDVEVVDHTGAHRRFVSDLAAGHVLVMSFMFTTCETLCPVTNSLLAGLEDRLAEEATGDVRIVSVTIDRVRDDTAALAASARAFGAGPDWFFVGGEDVPRLTRAFGMQPADIAFHDPVIFVGRADLGRYAPVAGFPTPDELLATVRAARALR